MAAGELDLQEMWNTREERRREAEERWEQAEALLAVQGIGFHGTSFLANTDPSAGVESDAPDILDLEELEREKAEFEAQEKLVDEYGALFEEKHAGLSDEVLAARQDAEEVGDRWPPRIRLSMIKPMAGAMHGFIAAHRHGDICRVAVHSPFNAEIVGFQYRDDRRINTDLAGAVAGLVVEHNYAQSWSGLVFRRTDAMEPPPADEAGADGEGSGDASSGTA